MLLLSSLHIHPSSLSAGDSCAECVHHHCGGHLGQQSPTTHDCLLCQFITLSYLAVAVATVIVYHPVYKLRRDGHSHILLRVHRGTIGLRGPPSC